MIGSVIGDVIGSTYEICNAGTWDFDPFPEGTTYTDDTVLTLAVAYSILHGTDYVSAIQEFACRYPGRGYGGMFSIWIYGENPQPYNSFGNGSAMRVSPVGFAFGSVEKVLGEARKSAECTHNHPEGIKGAQAVALAIFLARMGCPKKEIRERIVSEFGYDLDRKLNDIKPGYTFDITCQGTVPEAILAFLESEDFESAIRNAIWLGGDSDTLACITGGIAEAFYGTIPAEWQENTWNLLPEEFRQIITSFRKKFYSMEKS
ncbi:MAG TPA: ADP-ribosylglycohydrolase family protein [Bacteroidetes bacterium]|nr:ADP-ribosylglycohydrolase family protein [Bacteroidota bacterium]